MNNILTVFLLFLSIFTTKLVYSQQCGDQIGPIQSMKPHFGGMDPFYSIAKDISDGLQNTPSAKTYNDLNNLFFGNGNITANVVAKDLIYNQIGAIIFWSIGFVFVLAAIVLCIATAIWQCCFSCVPKPGNKNVIVGGVYFAFLFTIFAFILTGTILFNIATNDLVESVDDGLDYTNEISNDIQSVLTNGTMQLNCAVNQTTNTVFSQIEGILANYAAVVVNNTKEETGYNAVYNFDSSGYTIQNQATYAAQDKLKTSLAGINDGSDDCNAQILKYTQNFDPIRANLEFFDTASIETGAVIAPLTLQIQKMQDTIQQNTQAAADQMNVTQGNITSTIGSINGMVDDLQVDIKNVMNSLKTAHNDIVTSSQYTLVKVLVRLFVNLVACIAMLLAVYAMFSIAYGIKNKDEEVPNFIPLLVLISFYVSIFLAIVMILFSSAAFVGGWVVSAMCVPTFEDPQYRIFHLINRDTPSMNPGQVDTFNVGDVFASCNDPAETIFSAINGTNIISADDISQQLNLDSIRNQTNQQIADQKFAGFSFPMNNSKINDLNNDFDETKQANIASCNNDNANSAAADYMKKLEISVKTSNIFYNNTETLNNNVNKTQNITIDQNNEQFNIGEALINSSISDLITNLQQNVFKCRPLVDIYNNGGLVACSQYGKPIHGLWSSIGLAGLFMFTLSILLLLTYRWLKIEEGDGVEGKETSWDSQKSERRDIYSYDNDGHDDDDGPSPVFSGNQYNDTSISETTYKKPDTKSKAKKSKEPSRNEESSSGSDRVHRGEDTRIPRVYQITPFSDDFVSPSSSDTLILPRNYDGYNSGRGGLPRQHYTDSVNDSPTPSRGLRRM